MEYNNGNRKYTFCAYEQDELVYSVSGGPGNYWAVQPILPEGLTINSVSGKISGIPTRPVDPRSYFVTAANLASVVS